MNSFEIFKTYGGVYLLRCKCTTKFNACLFYATNIEV